MQRALRWRYYYTRRQREAALAVALGCSATAGVAAWQARTTVKADDDIAADDSSWQEKPTVVSHNASGKASKGSATKLPLPRSIRETQAPPSQTKDHAPLRSDDASSKPDDSGWRSATQSVTSASDSVAGIDLSTLGSKIASMVMPSWVRMLPGYVTKLRSELSGDPWSLSWEIWEDAHDPEINPEITWDARVRVSKQICPDEQSFLARRQRHTTTALARYLDVPESEIHPEDVPVIAICGSGGGLRALVAGASSYLSTQEDGLFDCVTYTAGVSGSCWLQALYYSSVGQQNHARIIDHLKGRIGVHIAYPPAALKLLNSAPTNKFLLSGFVEKLRGVPKADFGMVDVYGLLLAARLLVPRGELSVSDLDLKISNQRMFTDDGSHPLPIYTAVRHEIPVNLEGDIKPSRFAWHNTKQYDWFQWFEWTPYEFFCEELECGIPTWAVGRSWDGGRSQWRHNGLALPELRIPLMMGIWGSAFCATMSHYYKEIRPILKAGGLAKLDSVLAGKDEDLVKVHPIDPALIPNFALGLRDQLPPTVPESVHETSHLQLMDAGMSNNLPIYPLLRPGRDVDVIVAFDASADVRTDNWVKVVDGYARQRGIRGWPMGAGWPPQGIEPQQTAQQLADAQATSASDASEPSADNPYFHSPPADLGYCTVWVGTTEERQEYMDEPASRRLGADEDDDDLSHLTRPDAGVALVYFPFLANDKVPGVDPQKDDFMSTWNFVYTADEIDKVVALARANFAEGREQTRRTVRAVWQRKRDRRLQRERDQREWARVSSMRRSNAHMRRNGDHGQGDQFSG